MKPPTTSLASAYGPSLIVFDFPWTTLPACSSGCPCSLMWPFVPRSFIQATHFCKCFCISSGDWDVFLPRNRYVNSLIVFSPLSVLFYRSEEHTSELQS